MEKISVVIPAWNAEETIEKAVASVLAQERTEDRRTRGSDGVPDRAEDGCRNGFDLEILLVDDGSTDGTPALCDALAGAHPEIKVIHQKNAGVSAARNAGIRAASGTWLMTLDDDDYIDPGMFSAMLSAAKKEQADLVICGIRLLWPGTQREAVSAPEEEHEREGKEEADRAGARSEIYEEEPLAADRDEFLRKRMLSLYDKHLLTTHSNKLYDLERIRRENIFYDEDLQINEDSDFVFRYLKHAGRIVQVGGAYLNYVQHDSGQSLITTFRKNGVSSALKLSRDLEELFREMRGSTAGAGGTAGTGEAVGTAEESSQGQESPEQKRLAEGMDYRMLVHILSCAGQMYYRSELTDGEKLTELTKLTEEETFRRLLAGTKAADLKTGAAKFLLSAGLVPVYHLLCKVLYRHCR